jgi:hypothetical protein
MKTFKDGGPAFPVTTDHGSVYPLPGMTLRDYFAAAAMQGFMAGPHYSAYRTWSQDAQSAYEMADAMLAERTKTKEPQS